ncbi:hypothetical protein C2S52_015742 [Perilla frutescens var. hirtella]|nr:hypothetical protein C2S52_015742 [Perilla frutescens var. hirtella]
MECNKDEATRAKTIAESKLQQKDFLGAKKFALKAQTLYPGLHGISQMLTTLDVYLSAENKISGEVDWYQVLGVNPSDDEGTIKSQYRKLALMLHPDKNNSVGAIGAFQLISEACKLLEDKEKRMAYNQRMGYTGTQQKVQTCPSAPFRPHQHNGGQSVPPTPSQQKVPSAQARRSQKKGPSAQPRRRQQKVPAHAGGPSAPPQPSLHKDSARTGGPSVPPGLSQQKVSTPSMADYGSRITSTPKSQNRSAKVPVTPNPAAFWTLCRGCNTQFEYLKMYRNRTLRCQRCDKAFMATEIAPPTKFSKAAGPIPWNQQKHPFKKMPTQNAYDQGNVAAAKKPGAGQTSPISFPYTNYQQGPLPGTANTGSWFPSTAEKPGNVVPLAHDYLKRSHTESHDSAGWEGCFKKGKLDDDSNRYGINHNMPQGISDLGIGSAFGMGTYGFSGAHNQPSSTRELTPPETRKLLMLKAQKEILKKL